MRRGAVASGPLLLAVSTCGCAVTAVACGVGAAAAAWVPATLADTEAMIPWFVITGLAASANPFCVIDDAYSAAVAALSVLWAVIGLHSMQQQRLKFEGGEGGGNAVPEAVFGLGLVLMTRAWTVACAFLGTVAVFAASVCVRRRWVRHGAGGGSGVSNA
jgi:hypothetical protein